MEARPIEINWHTSLPIFAQESFLKSVSQAYGWLGGFSASDELRCILPYTIIKKAAFRMVRFRVETIPAGNGLEASDEKEFLNSVVAYFRSIGADMIIPATTNAVFRTYPDGADAAPYGSYLIDLQESQEELWRKVNRITRQNIGTASRNGVTIKDGADRLQICYQLIHDTFKRSKLPFMNYPSLVRYVQGLGEFGKVFYADLQGIAQSCTVYAFSEYRAYAVYGGNLPEAYQGTWKLLQWEAIRHFQNLGVRTFDFVGARINPEPGSKQEGLNANKRRFGAVLKEGFIWKYPLKPISYKLYNIAARFRSGGDIVDKERHKLEARKPNSESN